jgi:MFS family permease
MLSSSLAFWAMAASVSYIVLPVVFFTSCALGFCGASINIAQGVALAACTTDATRGRYSGIVQAFNQGATLPGNLMAIILIPASEDSKPPRPCGNTTETLLVPGDKPGCPLIHGHESLLFDFASSAVARS